MCVREKANIPILQIVSSTCLVSYCFITYLCFLQLSILTHLIHILNFCLIYNISINPIIVFLLMSIYIFRFYYLHTMLQSTVCILSPYFFFFLSDKFQIVELPDKKAYICYILILAYCLSDCM